MILDMEDSEDLLPLERRLMEAIEFGTSVRPPEPAKPDEDPAHGRSPGCEHTVRARILVQAATTERCPRGRRPVALKLCGARILDPLRLDGIEVCFPLSFHDCYFDELLSLYETNLYSLHISGCHVPRIVGRLLTTRGDIVLTDVVARQVNLEGAHISGDLRLSGSRLSGSPALEGTGLRVEHSVVCDRKFTTLGAVVLSGAHVGGTLDLSDARLSPLEGDAIRADAVHVGRDISCGAQFRADGGIFLAGADVGGRLDFRGARLCAPEKVALWAEQAQVHRGVWCSDGFEAQGLVQFIAARIDGPLNLEDGQFINDDKIALDCWGLRVDAGIWGAGCVARGALRFEGAHVRGAVHMTETTIVGTDAEGISLNLQRIDADELWLPTSDSPTGVVDLSGGATVQLHDNWPAAPKNLRSLRHRRAALGLGQSLGLPPPRHRLRYRLRLRGFVYQSLGSESADVAARLDWIAHAQEKYLPDAYDVLSSAVRRAGQDEDARRVAIAKQDARRATLSQGGRLANRFLRATVGYGYRPWRAAGWLLAVVLVCWGVFEAAWPAHMEERGGSARPPEFHAPLYALDAVLPVVRLGQEEYWAPTGAAQWWYAFSVLSGWVLGTVAIAAITARFVRE